MNRRKQRRKLERTPKQRAKDARVFACSRKVLYGTEAEAQAVADKLQHRVYRCSYGEHWHTAHLPGSQRFARGATVWPKRHLTVTTS